MEMAHPTLIERVMNRHHREVWVVDMAGRIRPTQILFMLMVGLESLTPCSDGPMPGSPICSNSFPVLSIHSRLVNIRLTVPLWLSLVVCIGHQWVGIFGEYPTKIRQMTVVVQISFLTLKVNQW